MTTEIQNYKQLITQLLNESKTQTLQQLQTEAGQLPDILSTGIFNLSSDYHIRNHICIAQAILTTQANQLYRHLKNQPDLTIAKALVLTLRVLDTLDQRFPEHTDSINPIPKAIYDKTCRRYQALPGNLRSKLERYGIKSELIDITLYPLTSYLNKTSSPSYHDHHYLGAYQQVLRELNLGGKKPAVAEDLLCGRLITINYNSLALADYLCAKITTELKAALSKPEKFRILKKMRSQLRPVGVREGLAFDQDFYQLKDALHQFIDGKEEQIRQAKERIKPSPAESKTKQRVYVSAGILAFMARLCKIAGIYPDYTRTEIIDHMISTYTSKKVDSITRVSFTNLWKKPSVPVARALRRILNTMLAEIEQYLATGRLSDQPGSGQAT